MKRDREIDDLIFSYFFGEISREDVVRLEDILSSSEEARDRFAELAEQEVTLKQTLVTQEASVPDSRRRNEVSLPKVRRQGYARIQRKVRAYRRRMWLSVAACLAIAAGSVYYHLFHRAAGGIQADGIGAGMDVGSDTDTAGFRPARGGTGFKTGVGDFADTRTRG